MALFNGRGGASFVEAIGDGIICRGHAASAAQVELVVSNAATIKRMIVERMSTLSILEPNPIAVRKSRCHDFDHSIAELEGFIRRRWW